MKRISLKQLVILAPLLIALPVGWYFAGVHRARRDAIAVFDRCVEQNEPLILGSAVEHIGKEDTILRIENASKQNSNIVFDGDLRFAQILPGNHDNGRGPADGYSLTGLGGSIGSSIWNAPAGTRISSMVFRDDFLIISIYGDLIIGSFNCAISETEPEEYAIRWPSDSPDPPDHDLEVLILKRHPNATTQGPTAGNQ